MIKKFLIELRYIPLGLMCGTTNFYCYRMHHTPIRSFEKTVGGSLFKYIDDNVLSNQLLAKAHSFGTCQCWQLFAELSCQTGGNIRLL